MLAAFKKWSAARKARKFARDFQRGHDYATGQLTCDPAARGNIADRLCVQADCFDRTAFDKGIEAAVFAAERQGLLPAGWRPLDCPL